MYKVKYYLSGGTLVSKYFPTLHEAIVFTVYKTGFGQVYGIDLIKD
jgi:hypothetical protein